MAETKIVVVGPNEVGLIVDLYNQVFTPPVDEDFFMRRFQAKHNVSLLVAELEQQPVGFVVGFEVNPTTYLSWLCGVIPDARRAGVATQLIQAQLAWANENDYQIIRFECQNQHRPMLHLAISEGYDVVGIRCETASMANIVIFEKDLR